MFCTNATLTARTDVVELLPNPAVQEVPANYDPAANGGRLLANEPHRPHAATIHRYQLIARRIRCNAAFRRFIEKMERQIVGTAPTTAAAA